MWEQFFDSVWRVEQLDSNPAGPWLERFAQHLSEAGYARNMVQIHIRAAEHLVVWSQRRGIPIEALNEAGVESFKRHLRRCRCPHFYRTYPVSRQHGALLFLEYFRASRGVVAPAASQPALLTAFQEWMQQQRGTSKASLYNYSLSIRDLLKTLGNDPSHFNARNLRQFVLERNEHSGPGKTRSCITGVRMFLRFLVAEGKCPPGLDSCVPAVANWRLSSLPQYLQQEEVERIIKSCNQRTAVGRRDRAILLLLARMGLRAGDVQHLQLSDIDWEQAWIHVSGKGRRQTRLPLTQEVGDAIARYLQQGRPPCTSNHVFVRSRAPFRPLKSHAGIGMTVVYAMQRAGVKCQGRGAAHLLRHSAATSMLRHGTSLQDISVILRHRSIETTELYAKTDVNMLRTIAQPWPEVKPC